MTTQGFHLKKQSKKSKAQQQISKNSVLKSIVHVIEHNNLQFYMAYLWWTMRAKLFLRTILISKVNFSFMFNLNLKINLKLNFKFISNSVSFENHSKILLISIFYFKLTLKGFLVLFPILKI